MSPLHCWSTGWDAVEQEKLVEPRELLRDACVSYISVAVIKHYKQNQLMKTELVLAYGSRE